ncbi:HD-GYP domain-containing protein [Beijerinckia sp. L45]|uniref:HD-GYP domain-containing protein n=1 Tax=Beijerinckia sp. L45 TaxID=1641855 RepID=UPI00131B15B7|nr:HD domain-containing phosphohydrolase [Beijerinckia sp. L45]
MLLITDRPSEAHHLHKTLSQIQNCAVIAWHQVATYLGAPSIVICDIGFGSQASIELFRDAVSRYSDDAKAPLLCLTRDDAHFSDMQRHADGAAMVLRPETPQATLVEIVKSIVRRKQVRAGDAELHRFVRRSIGEADTVLVGLFEDARRGHQVSLSNLERGGRAIVAAVGRSRIRAWLDVVWHYDDITYQHCLLVAGLTAAFSFNLGLSLNKQHFLSQAALLHDIGKARIPLKILNKPGKLTGAEMDVMRGHTTIGAEMISSRRAVDRQFREIVRSHHEYLDGTGYPDGLRGEQISNFMRVITICDIYGALIERRSYKEPLPAGKALAELVAMGPKLDGGLVKAFHRMILDA